MKILTLATLALLIATPAMAQRYSYDDDEYTPRQQYRSTNPSDMAAQIYGFQRRSPPSVTCFTQYVGNLATTTCH